MAGQHEAETIPVLNRLINFFGWFATLFNPPPRETMSQVQKIIRSFFVTLVLVVTCTLVSMALALGIFVIEKGHRLLLTVPMLVNGVIIILVSGCVNTVCVLILLRVQKMDQKLIPPKEEPPEKP